MKFIELKMHFVNNEAIENLYYYKYFFLELAPFDLNLDGNFCDEIYKYILDIFSQTNKLVKDFFNTIQSKHKENIDHINLYEDPEGDIEKMKQTFNELKKPYERREI